MTKLSQFFRNVGSTLARNPEVRTAVRELEKKVVQEAARGFQRFADGFEAPKAKPVSLTAPTQASANADYVTGLYRDLLGREPDAEGLRSHLAGMARGATRDDIRQVFLTSPEYLAKQAPAAPAQTPPATPAPVPAPVPPGTLSEPGAPLSTVPLLPEYAAARIDTSSPAAAALSAAQWAKDTSPELFAHSDDRQVCFQIMTKVVGALRAAGYDATRVVNHPDRPVGDGWRYGSDAIVLNGEVFDVYRGMGESNTPQAMDAGPYEAGRLRE